MTKDLGTTHLISLYLIMGFQAGSEGLWHGQLFFTFHFYGTAALHASYTIIQTFSSYLHVKIFFGHGYN